MRRACVAAVLLGMSWAAAAQPAPSAPAAFASPITDDFALTGLYEFGTVSTGGRVDSPTGARGTPFSAERDFGLSAQARMPRVEVMLRLAQRNRLRVDFVDLRRQGAATAAAPLLFGSQSFSAGQPLQSQLDWRQTDFTYTYSFLRGRHFELGAGAALHLIETEARVQVAGMAQHAAYSAAGPFATLALDGTYAFTQRWSINARAQYLRLTIDGSSGELGEYHADVQFRCWPNLAIGAGYDEQRVAVDLQRASPSGTVHMNIAGPVLFVRMAF